MSQSKEIRRQLIQDESCDEKLRELREQLKELLDENDELQSSTSKLTEENEALQAEVNGFKMKFVESSSKAQQNRGQALRRTRSKKLGRVTKASYQEILTSLIKGVDVDTLAEYYEVSKSYLYSLRRKLKQEGIINGQPSSE